MVRLKGIINGEIKTEYKTFQFLMVRLKVLLSLLVVLRPIYISIPYGSIKRKTQKEYIYTGL